MSNRIVTLRLPAQAHLVIKSNSARADVSISEYLRELVYADIDRRQEVDRLTAMEQRLSDKISQCERLIRVLGSILKRAQQSGPRS